MTTLDGLIDANIIIDSLRGYTPAQQWILQNQTLTLGLLSLVRMEIVFGTQNKVELQKIGSVLNNYPLIYPNETDAKWAMEQFEKFHLSNRIEIVDCFLAATSLRLSVPIYTRNQRDFRVFPSVVAIIPYS
ncbi:MAG: hypothetical protein H7Y09_14550 [Chitinophagaceae bacterium]|nr:hypothetical protein [Anaerolineae bacterium]